MSSGPNPLQLLEAARRALADEIAARVPGDARYQVLLAANAIAIAARELAGADEVFAREADAMEKLLGDGEPDVSAARERHRVLEARLAEAVRDGRFDDPSRHTALRECLRAMTLRVLAETNPRIATRRGAVDAG